METSLCGVLGSGKCTAVAMSAASPRGETALAGRRESMRWPVGVMGVNGGGEERPVLGYMELLLCHKVRAHPLHVTSPVPVHTVAEGNLAD